MQYCSRINIRVDSVEDWKKLYSMDIEQYGSYVTAQRLFGNDNSKDFVIDGDFGMSEIELDSFVVDIIELLDKKCIIIADTYSISVDPYKYCICYFGDYKRTEEISERKSKIVNDIDSTDMNDIAEWINATKFKLTETEKEFLKKYEIVYDEEKKKYIDILEEKRKRKIEEEKRKKKKKDI